MPEIRYVGCMVCTDQNCAWYRFFYIEKEENKAENGCIQVFSSTKMILD